MTQSLMLPQNAISTFQTQVAALEQCLNCSNTNHEIMAELYEIANTRQISQDELRQEMLEFQQQLAKLIKLLKHFQGSVNEKQSPLLYFVKYQLLLKEILESYWDFFFGTSQKEVIRELTTDEVALYKEIKNRITPETPKQDINYVALETLKHSLKSLVDAGLRVNAFSQQEVDTFDLGDITPQESETVLIFLSTMKRWEPVYHRLAVS